MYTTMNRCFTAPLCIVIYLVVCVSHVSGFTYGMCVVHYPIRIHDATKMFCYQQELNRVPPKIPLNVTEIDISHNKIKKIKSQDFINLTQLRTLNISYNSISYVEIGAFRDLINLTELFLSSNTLTMITKDLFQGLTNLKVLFLEKNNISNIEKSSFSVFHHLECVKLSANKIRDMKLLQPIFRLQTLNELHIADNNISIFQSSHISNSSVRLKVLDLSHNPLHVFRISADIFPYLKEVNLSYGFPNGILKWDVLNTSFFRNVKRLDVAALNVSVVAFNVILQTFNNTLSQLSLSSVHSVQSLISRACLIPSLLSLNLRNNKIRTLKRTGLEKCFQVKVIDLYGNSLTDLEDIFASLKNLTSLKLGYNNFSTIPKIIQKLPLLENLDFAFNRIKDLGHSCFKNLTHLKTLYLYGNRIDTLRDSFQNLTNLRQLYLRSNNVKFLEGAFRDGPGKLEYLDLSSNSLVSIYTDDFKGLKSLKMLILNDNKINSIDDRAFFGLINLRQLNLESNKLTDKSLRPDVFLGLANLSRLLLSHNNLLKTNVFQNSPFYHLQSLKYLYIFSQLHHNVKTFLPSSLLQNLTCLDSFWGQDIGLKYLPDDLFKDNTELTQLGLSENDFTTLSPKVFLPLQKLYRLYLKETHLKTLDFVARANLAHLYYLQVSSNQITSINDTIIKSLPALRLLYMQENTFTCDCTNAQFIKWIEEDNLTQVFGANIYKCNSPPELKQTQLLKLDVHSCSVDVEFFCYISSMSLVLLTLVISLIYHFLHWQIVYAYYLFLAFLYDNKKKGSKNSLGFQYDAFVSYNTLDELWVTNELLPKLEGEQGWRLCLHHRDFQPGKPIVDNIVDGIYSSRKTICVISQHYLESEWCSREVQVASFRLFDEKKDVLILVFLEDIPVYRLSPYYRMRGLVKKRTYLRWPKAGQDTRVFWEKLRVALGARRGSQEENSLSDVQNAL